jgi:hypothetical protein
MDIQTLQLPPIPSSIIKRNAMRHFLQTNTLGSFECKWECTKTQNIIGIRLERRRSQYYREPGDLFLTILCPSLTYFPSITYPLQDKDVKSLLSALE